MTTAAKSKQSDQAVIAQARAAGAYTVNGKQYTYDAMMALLAKAHQGDTEAWAIVSEVFSEKDPTALIEAAPNPDQQARGALLDTVLGKDLPVKASYAARADKMARDLEGPNASELERILCQRVTTCWLDANLADTAFYSQVKKDGGSISESVLRWHEYRRERANGRYLAAVTTLARVRRLLAPVMQQVNIATPGSQQVNMATPSTILPNALKEATTNPR